MSWTSWVSVVLVVSSCCNTHTVRGSCPPGWTRFFNECYIIADNSLPWKAAKMECNSFPFQARLPQPRTHSSLVNLVTFLQSSGESDTFWLGAGDVMSQGKFRWLSRPDKSDNTVEQLDLTDPVDVSGPMSSTGWRAVALHVSGTSSDQLAMDPETEVRVICQRGLLPTTGTK